jgi:hypothetical protein
MVEVGRSSCHLPERRQDTAARAFPGLHGTITPSIGTARRTPLRDHRPRAEPQPTNTIGDRRPQRQRARRGERSTGRPSPLAGFVRAIECRRGSLASDAAARTRVDQVVPDRSPENSSGEAVRAPSSRSKQRARQPQRSRFPSRASLGPISPPQADSSLASRSLRDLDATRSIVLGSAIPQRGRQGLGAVRSSAASVGSTIRASPTISASPRTARGRARFREVDQDGGGRGVAGRR